MGYEKTGDIIREAYKNNYGVPSFNICNYETIKFAVDAAEIAGKPVIVQLYPGFRDYISFEITVEITRRLAEKAKVPVGLHLDHCHDIETLKYAMRSGFLSVMYDGSKLPFEENIKTTLEASEAAKEFGADLEAELGNIGSAADISGYTDSSKFTDPDDALKFLDETGINSLAVAVGNAHGDYAATPNLDLARIEKISGLLKIPLVLHGGSGIPDEQLQKSVRLGIAKINVATDFFRAFQLAASEYINDKSKKEDIFACMKASKAKTMEFLAGKINLFNY
ncbi:MAG: class II fructose-bisphosphate aldolase [Oscillospiraceae bacterium]|nr:class II fructose-bisphosphate aldolase [Oscillospiraceae bacterium]